MSLRSVILALLACSLSPLAQAAPEPKELADARQELKAHPDEATRVRVILQLIDLRKRLARDRNGDWQAVDAEIARHPMSPKSDTDALKKELVGKWASPRHPYLLRSNGTWTMLPELDDGVRATHGVWRIEGNRYFEGMTKADSVSYTILVLTKKDFVFADKTTVFYRNRGDAYVE